jgi:rod shape-determining protein MreC
MHQLRNKSIITLFALILSGVVIGVAHNRALSEGHPFVIQSVVRSAIYPAGASIHSVVSLFAQVMRVARPRSAILRENARLRKQVKLLTEENNRLRELAHESISLKKTLHLHECLGLKTISAEVIARDESSWFHTATIDRGRRAGVTPGASVVNHLGLIGQVVEADPFTAQVVALTDTSSEISALVQRSRCHGLLQGLGGNRLVLTSLPKDADVRRGDVVVSSGLGRVIPKGLVVGRIIRVSRNSIYGTTSAFVRPAVRFDQVEQVLVIKPGRGVAR